jgi:hypothetical protein
MHAFTGQGIEIRRQRRDQGLAFAGPHLGDLALVQRHAADHLDVEMAHKLAASRFRLAVGMVADEFKSSGGQRVPLT